MSDARETGERHRGIPPERDRERRRAAAFGWGALAMWASAGLVLEAMHGIKVAAYLDDPLTRLLLTLMHAHGVGLALVCLAWAAVGVPFVPADAAASLGRTLRILAVVLPIGFGAASFAHPEGDPNPVIFLVPVAGLALVATLGRIAWFAFRSPDGPWTGPDGPDAGGRD